MNSHGSSFWSSLELHAKHHYIQTLWILSTELPVSPGVQAGQQASYFIASTQLLQVWPSIFSSGALRSKHVDTSSVSSQYHSNDNNLGPLLHFLNPYHDPRRIITLSVIQMRKWRSWEVKSFSPGHTARRWGSRFELGQSGYIDAGKQILHDMERGRDDNTPSNCKQLSKAY